MNEQNSAKKNDTLWFFLYGVLAVAVIYLIWSGILLSFNINSPYIAGFVQFGIFASAGELASGRILQKKWTVDSVFIFKGISWAVLGVITTYAFNLFSGGVEVLMETGMLPFYGNTLAFGIFASCSLNIIFGVFQNEFIRMCASYADLRYRQKKRKITIREIALNIDWGELVDFALFKTIPFFWIPSNIILFLLPSAVRIIIAALLSFAFGIFMAILTLRERKKSAEKQHAGNEPC